MDDRKCSLYCNRLGGYAVWLLLCNGVCAERAVLVVDGLEGTVNLSASSFLLLGLSSRAMRIKYQELLPWLNSSHLSGVGPLDLMQLSVVL